MVLSFFTERTLWLKHSFGIKFYARKPKQAVILTGSQLPIGTLWTDGKKNLITAIEIAAARTRTEQPSFLRWFAYF